MSILSMHPKRFVSLFVAALAFGLGGSPVGASALVPPQGPTPLASQAALGQQQQEDDWDAVLPLWGYASTKSGSGNVPSVARTGASNVGGGGSASPSGGADGAPLAPQVAPASGKVPNVFGGGGGVPIPAIARPISVFLP